MLPSRFASALALALVPGVLSQSCTTTSITTSDACTVTGDAATCSAQASSPPLPGSPRSFTLNNCLAVSCRADNSCKNADIQNIPSGGHVDCHSGGLNGQSCDGAQLHSTHPFTLSCGGLDDSQQTGECSSAQVTNPGGSVFCFGGGPGGEMCNGMTLSNSVGCVICGSDHACTDDLQIQGESPTPGNVFVYSQCSAADVAKYLNKMHPCSTIDSLFPCTSPACQDKNKNGVCDVVEAYCANHPKDTNCQREFLQNAPWEKTAANDKKNEEEEEEETNIWVIGGIVLVGSFLIAILLMVLFLWKKICRGKQAQEASRNTVLVQMQKLNPQGPNETQLQAYGSTYTIDDEEEV